MKKLILSSFVIVACLGLTNCADKIKTDAPYKNITVIYALLDRSDTAHYVRIQKAFLDENKSALEMAKTPDSNFYSLLNVTIKRISFSGNLYDTIHLDKVDLTMEGYPKQPGTFFTSPNYGYKFKGVLDSSLIYRILVTNPATGEVDSAEAPVIDNRGTTFYINVIDDYLVNHEGLDFASSLPIKHFDFFTTYLPPANFTFQDQACPAFYAQAVLTFNWQDSNTITGTKTPKSYDFQLGNIILSAYGNAVQAYYKIFNIDLYNALSAGMQKAPENTARLIDRADLSIYLGTKEYYNYYQTLYSQNTGLTGTYIEPIFTNIKGKNVLGLFTSKAGRTGKITITDETVDSIMVHPLLVGSRVVGTVYH